MELALPLSQLETAATAISATRPTLAGDGVDITTWKQGAYQLPSFLIFLLPDANRTVDSPTGGASGPEVWMYINSIWVLVSYFRAAAAIAVPAGGYAETFRTFAVGDRVAIAGTKSGGTVNFRAEPVEYIAQLIQ